MNSELDSLKNAWKTISDAQRKNEYSDGELMKMVKKRSNNELLKIRRKLLVEWTVAIALSVLLVVFIQIINPNDTKYALVFVGLILLVSFYPYYNLLKLRFTQQANVKCHLKEFLSRFDLLVSQYIKLSVILIPIAGIGGFLLGFHSASNADEWQSFFTLRNLLILIGFVGLISVGGYWVQRRYFKWMYGKNIERLKNCVSDLEEAETLE